MGELRAAINTDVPPAQLWAVATDWPNQRRFIPMTTARVVGDGRIGTGSRVEAFTGVGGFGSRLGFRVGFLDPMVLDRWEPPHHLAVRHVGRVVRGTAGFTIAPLGRRGSRIEWWERIEPPLGAVGRAGWPLVAPLLRWGLQRSLRRLAATASAFAR